MILLARFPWLPCRIKGADDKARHARKHLKGWVEKLEKVVSSLYLSRIMSKTNSDGDYGSGLPSHSPCTSSHPQHKLRPTNGVRYVPNSLHNRLVNFSLLSYKLATFFSCSANQFG